ncbi:MAG: serine hydrolase [Bacteroidales bacterium]|nr:serine hydrolase [Bacteroidales bacterium]
MISKTIKILRFAVILLLVGCFSGNVDSEYQYSQPRENGDGLRSGTLSEVGLDSELIVRGVQRINRDKYGEIHSLLIYKKGKLVLEEYFSGHDYQWDAPNHYGSMVKWNGDMPHSAHSVSKSITSLCVGIAVDKGFIKDVHQSIFDYLPENYKYLCTKNKEYITIENLLTCTSGLQWAEWNAPLSSRENDQIGIWFHEKGPVDFVLQRPFVEEPGKQFNYSGGGIELLGVILEQASGMGLDEFSKKYLFEPLGIKNAEWNIIYPTGEFSAASGLKMTPRDMVKIGAMMMNGGTWKGNRIVSEDWVEKSKQPYAYNKNIKVPGEDLGRMGYAYTWWTKDLKIRGMNVNWYSANGWGGQKIIVLPEIETVIVFTGANYTSKVKQYDLLDDYILAAMKDS